MTYLLTPQILLKARRSFKRKYVIVLDSIHTLKLGPASIVTSYEYRILRLLEGLGSLPLPCPRPIDFFTIKVLPSGVMERDGDGEGEAGEEWNVIVMSTLPGRTFGKLSHTMASEERVRVLVEVRGFMEIVNEAMSMLGSKSEGDFRAGHDTSTISDLDGGRCLKLPLLDGYIYGRIESSSFVSKMEEATPQTLSLCPLQHSILSTLSPSPSETIQFCHMDLHPGNILLSDGRISGIVDWELSGLYTPKLDAFSALMNVIPSRELEADYMLAWGVGPDLVQMANSSTRELAKGVMRRKMEARNGGVEGMRLKGWRRRRVVGKGGNKVSDVNDAVIV